MSQVSSSPEMTAEHPTPSDEVGRKLKFGKNDGFQAELKRRVEEYFRTTGRRQRDCWRMYLKTAIILTTFVSSYVLLVFFAATWWQAVPLALLLAGSTALIGFNIQHDGGHHAYSDYSWINKLTSMSLDLIGGSSYLWHWRHAVVHHTYVNVHGHDTDIDLGDLGRLSPHQPRLAIHRWQHLYLWLLYGLVAIKWHLFTDFEQVYSGHVGPHRIPRPRGWDLLIFLGGKLTFVTLAFILPMMFHAWWVVLLFYALVACVLGVLLSVVFQLAHTVGEAEFPIPTKEAGRIDNPWAVHQVETAVNFSRKSWVACWLLGGLNFQIEHHLFPRICHTNYPGIADMVQATCKEFGVRYVEHPSFLAGLASHYRFLRQMGQPA